MAEQGTRMYQLDPTLTIFGAVSKLYIGPKSSLSSLTLMAVISLS